MPLLENCELFENVLMKLGFRESEESPGRIDQWLTKRGHHLFIMRKNDLPYQMLEHISVVTTFTCKQAS